MESIFNFCEKCGKTTEYVVTNITEGDNCWKKIEIECVECGNKSELKVNA